MCGQICHTVSLLPVVYTDIVCTLLPVAYISIVLPVATVYLPV